MGIKKVPDEEGRPIKSLGDAVRELARWYLDRPALESIIYPDVRSRMMKILVKEYSCQGVIIHLNRGCELTAFGQMENRVHLVEAGIPVMTYEGNMADSRDLDRAQVIDRIDAFMEGLGLNKLEN